MIKLSERSNKTIMIEIAHPQRTKTVQPLGMYVPDIAEMSFAQMEG